MSTPEIHIEFDLSDIDILRPTMYDIGPLSAFFEDVARDVPRSQRDDVQARYQSFFTGRALKNFIEDTERNIALMASGPQGVVGCLYARFTSAAEQRQSLWSAPQDKATLMWYGVQADILNIPYTQAGHTVGDELVQTMQDDLVERFDCNLIDAYVHHANGPAKSSMIRNEFFKLGRVNSINHGPKDTVFAAHYDVWRYIP